MVYRKILFIAGVFFALALAMGCSKSRHASFVPDRFSLPKAIRIQDVHIEQLTVAHAELDYDAVMESKYELRKYFGGDWPADDFTLEQNKKDLVNHEMLSKQRMSFAYTIMDVDRSRVIGCIYVNPADSIGFDAQVHSWLRTGEKNVDLPSIVHEWMDSQWPFNRVLYWHQSR